DLDGNEYIDLGTGISVTSLGHQDPEITAALLEQARKLWHTSNIYWNEPSIRLAEELVAAAPFAERVFFCNSGAEANEAAIKLARKWSSLSFPPDKREIITFQGSFHGRTLTTVTATAQPKYHQGFEPLPGGFSYCPFNDFEAIEGMICERTCAVLVEPIQGEGGIVPAAEGFLKHLRQLCDRHQALLIFDEVQCGMGRTGRLFAHQWEAGVEPDVLTLAKALGNGFPIGAMLTASRVAQVLGFGSHGSTFGGSPMGAAVARVVLAKLRSPQLLDHVQAQGEALRQRLTAINESLEMFNQIRGRGLMVGAVLRNSWKGRAGELTELARTHGVLVLQAGPDVLRFLPPLSLTDEELDQGMERLLAALKAAG
ncbi:MAG: aspartate aminotransferase family protein, partial [Candidatus Competibacteraceae bacterium]|nr:aspartate aminotransferase family protein [Candidatus Competibacteraceae bacterium]